MTTYTGDQFCSAALFLLLDVILHFTKQEDCASVYVCHFVQRTAALWMSVSITATAAG